MNSPARSAVYQAACSCPRDSHYPENSPISKRYHGFTVSYTRSYYENNRHAPEQIAPGSSLEVSPTRRLRRRLYREFHFVLASKPVIRAQAN